MLLRVKMAVFMTPLTMLVPMVRLECGFWCC